MRSPARSLGRSRRLLNLDLDIVFVGDTTSTYFELEVPDELADLQEVVDDDGISRPVEQGKRPFGHSMDFRTDLPPVVIAMAVTRDGVPVRCWTFPGDTGDTSIIRTVKDDLAGWNLHRMVWVADRGFASAANRAYLTRGGHYIRVNFHPWETSTPTRASTLPSTAKSPKAQTNLMAPCQRTRRNNPRPQSDRKSFRK